VALATLLTAALISAAAAAAARNPANPAPPPAAAPAAGGGWDLAKAAQGVAPPVRFGGPRAADPAAAAAAERASLFKRAGVSPPPPDQPLQSQAKSNQHQPQQHSQQQQQHSQQQSQPFAGEEHMATTGWPLLPQLMALLRSGEANVARLPSPPTAREAAAEALDAVLDAAFDAPPDSDNNGGAASPSPSPLPSGPTTYNSAHFLGARLPAVPRGALDAGIRIGDAPARSSSGGNDDDDDDDTPPTVPFLPAATLLSLYEADGEAADLAAAIVADMRTATDLLASALAPAPPPSPSVPAAPAAAAAKADGGRVVKVGAPPVAAPAAAAPAANAPGTQPLPPGAGAYMAVRAGYNTAAAAGSAPAPPQSPAADTTTSAAAARHWMLTNLLRNYPCALPSPSPSPSPPPSQPSTPAVAAAVAGRSYVGFGKPPTPAVAAAADTEAAPAAPTPAPQLLRRPFLALDGELRVGGGPIFVLGAGAGHLSLRLAAALHNHTVLSVSWLRDDDAQQTVPGLQVPDTLSPADVHSELRRSLGVYNSWMATLPALPGAVIPLHVADAGAAAVAAAAGSTQPNNNNGPRDATTVLSAVTAYLATRVASTWYRRADDTPWDGVGARGPVFEPRDAPGAADVSRAGFEPGLIVVPDLAPLHGAELPHEFEAAFGRLLRTGRQFLVPASLPSAGSSVQGAAAARFFSYWQSMESLLEAAASSVSLVATVRGVEVPSRPASARGMHGGATTTTGASYGAAPPRRAAMLLVTLQRQDEAAAEDALLAALEEARLPAVPPRGVALTPADVVCDAPLLRGLLEVARTRPYVWQQSEGGSDDAAAAAAAAVAPSTAALLRGLHRQADGDSLPPEAAAATGVPLDVALGLGLHAGDTGDLVAAFLQLRLPPAQLAAVDASRVVIVGSGLSVVAAAAPATAPAAAAAAGVATGGTAAALAPPTASTTAAGGGSNLRAVRPPPSPAASPKAVRPPPITNAAPPPPAAAKPPPAAAAPPAPAAAPRRAPAPVPPVAVPPKQPPAAAPPAAAPKSPASAPKPPLTAPKPAAPPAAASGTETDPLVSLRGPPVTATVTEPTESADNANNAAAADDEVAVEEDMTDGTTTEEAGAGTSTEEEEFEVPEPAGDDVEVPEPEEPGSEDVEEPAARVPPPPPPPPAAAAPGRPPRGAPAALRGRALLEVPTTAVASEGVLRAPTAWADIRPVLPRLPPIARSDGGAPGWTAAQAARQDAIVKMESGPFAAWWRVLRGQLAPERQEGAASWNALVSGDAAVLLSTKLAQTYGGTTLVTLHPPGARSTAAYLDRWAGARPGAGSGSAATGKDAAGKDAGSEGRVSSVLHAHAELLGVLGLKNNLLATAALTTPRVKALLAPLLTRARRTGTCSGPECTPFRYAVHSTVDVVARELVTDAVATLAAAGPHAPTSAAVEEAIVRIDGLWAERLASLARLAGTTFMALPSYAVMLHAVRIFTPPLVHAPHGEFSVPWPPAALGAAGTPLVRDTRYLPPVGTAPAMWWQSDSSRGSGGGAGRGGSAGGVAAAGALAAPPAPAALAMAGGGAGLHSDDVVYANDGGSSNGDGAIVDVFAPAPSPSSQPVRARPDGRAAGIAAAAAAAGGPRLPQCATLASRVTAALWARAVEAARSGAAVAGLPPALAPHYAQYFSLFEGAAAAGSLPHAAVALQAVAGAGGSVSVFARVDAQAWAADTAAATSGHHEGVSLHALLLLGVRAHTRARLFRMYLSLPLPAVVRTALADGWQVGDDAAPARRLLLPPWSVALRRDAAPGCAARLWLHLDAAPGGGAVGGKGRHRAFASAACLDGDADDDDGGAMEGADPLGGWHDGSSGGDASAGGGDGAADVSGSDDAHLVEVWAAVASQMSALDTATGRAPGKFSFVEHAAGMGEVSLLVARAFPNATVLSLEPDARACDAHLAATLRGRLFNNLIARTGPLPETVRRIYDSPEFFRYQLASMDLAAMLLPGANGGLSFERTQQMVGTLLSLAATSFIRMPSAASLSLAFTTFTATTPSASLVPPPAHAYHPSRVSLPGSSGGMARGGRGGTTAGVLLPQSRYSLPTVERHLHAGAPQCVSLWPAAPRGSPAAAAGAPAWCAGFGDVRADFESFGGLAPLAALLGGEGGEATAARFELAAHPRAPFVGAEERLLAALVRAPAAADPIRIVAAPIAAAAALPGGGAIDAITAPTVPLTALSPAMAAKPLPAGVPRSLAHAAGGVLPIVTSGVVRVDLARATRHVNHHFQSELDGHARKYTLHVQANVSAAAVLSRHLAQGGRSDWLAVNAAANVPGSRGEGVVAGLYAQLAAGNHPNQGHTTVGDAGALAAAAAAAATARVAAKAARVARGDTSPPAWVEIEDELAGPLAEAAATTAGKRGGAAATQPYDLLPGVTSVILTRDMDGAFIPYDSVHGITLISLLRLGLLSQLRMRAYHQFVALPLYLDMAPWNIVAVGGKLDYIDYDTRDRTYDKFVIKAYEVMEVLFNYKRTLEDFKKCGAKGSNPYGFPFVSECVGGADFTGPCKDSAAPVACGDGTCKSDYISCLRSMSEDTRASDARAMLRSAFQEYAAAAAAGGDNGAGAGGNGGGAALLPPPPTSRDGDGDRPLTPASVAELVEDLLGAGPPRWADAKRAAAAAEAAKAQIGGKRPRGAAAVPLPVAPGGGVLHVPK